MKAKVIKTENGWEPAFLYDGGWEIEPGFALPTKREAEAALRRDIEQCAIIDAQQCAYSSGIDYACGYRD